MTEQAQLLEKFDQLIGVMNKVAVLLEREQTEWIDPDEACRMLGFKVMKSGSHRRKLQAARERGLLTSFQPGRPIKYNRKEIQQLSEKLSQGALFI